MNLKRILVVDDDREFAEAIAMRCRGLGLKAKIVSTPLAAITEMVVHPPDLLCLDVGLPTGNGLDLCEHVVRKSAGPQVPVIILTGKTDRETTFRAASMRACYVHKSSGVWRRLRPVIEDLLKSSAA